MRNHHSPLAILALVALTAMGCGNASTMGVGVVTVEGIAEGQEILCGSATSSVVIAGKGFLSEHGIEITVRFDATEGEPFQGGTATWEEVVGTVLSDTLVEVPVPNAVGTIEATITVTLPGGNMGVSPPQIMEIGGEVFGPYAISDVYGKSRAAIGNVTYTVDAANGVLANDIPSFCGEEEEPYEEKGADAPRRVRSPGIVEGYDPFTEQGGSVVVNPDGSFEYQPPLGLNSNEFQDYDRFTYTLFEPGRPPSTATVEIYVHEMVWFIDSTAEEEGDGHFSSPFDSLNAFMDEQGGGDPAQPEEGDWIFIYEGTREPYDGGIVLLDDQKLIGHGVDLVVNGRTLVTAANPPVLTNTEDDGQGGQGIILANANTIRGLTVLQTLGNGIWGLDVGGPTIVSDTQIMDAGSCGVLLEGDCFGSFNFAPTVSVTDAFEVGVCILTFGPDDNGEPPIDELPSLTFDGQFVYEGTISQTDAGRAIYVGATTPGSSVVFTNGTITYDGTTTSEWGAIHFEAVMGTVEVTSPQTIRGTPGRGILIYDCPYASLTFADTTIDIHDNGFSHSGVWIGECPGATITFTNLDITIAGDPETNSGGVGIEAGNLGFTSTKTHGLQNPPGTTYLIVEGVSRIDMTDAEQACVILGAQETGAPFDLDVTFESLSVNGSPQGGGLQFGDCRGTFTVTGTTTITNFDNIGILCTDGDCDLTFNVLNITNGTGTVGIGVDLVNSYGLFTVASGVISNMTYHGISLEDAEADVNNVAFSSITVDVIKYAGTCEVSGSGNSATTYGNLCNVGTASVTGWIDFGALGQCPPP